MYILLIVFMYALWSSVFSLSKLALQCSPPIFLTGFRMTAAGLIILVYLFFKDRYLFKMNIKQYFSLFILSIFSIYLTNILEMWGLQYLSTAKTCFIYSFSPFFAAFFSYLHFGETMNIRKWLGLFIGLLGFIPVLLNQTDLENFLNAFSFISWPSLAIIGAALCSVYGWVLLRLIVKNSVMSPVMANGVSMLIGGIIALVHSFFTEIWEPIPVSINNLVPFIKGNLIMIFISNIVCYNIYGFLLKRFTASFLSFFGLLSPFFASFSGWFLIGEVFSLSIFLASGIVVIGLWIVYHAELKQGYVISDKQASMSPT